MQIHIKFYILESNIPQCQMIKVEFGFGEALGIYSRHVLQICNNMLMFVSYSDASTHANNITYYNELTVIYSQVIC